MIRTTRATPISWVRSTGRPPFGRAPSTETTAITTTTIPRIANQFTHPLSPIGSRNGDLGQSAAESARNRLTGYYAIHSIRHIL